MGKKVFVLLPMAVGYVIEAAFLGKFVVSFALDPQRMSAWLVIAAATALVIFWRLFWIVLEGK